MNDQERLAKARQHRYAAEQRLAEAEGHGGNVALHGRHVVYSAQTAQAAGVLASAHATLALAYFLDKVE